MLSPIFGSAISPSSFLRAFVEPRGSVAARRIPAGCRSKLSFEPFALPIKREAERRNSRARNAAPVGPSYDRTCPSSGRELPAHNADRRAFRRPTAAFSLDPGTAFWKRTGAPIRTPLIPRGFPRFHPLHQPVAGRTHVVGPGDISQDPRRLVDETEPAGAAPAPPTSATGWRPLSSRDGWNIVAVGDENQAGGNRNL